VKRLARTALRLPGRRIVPPAILVLAACGLTAAGPDLPEDYGRLESWTPGASFTLLQTGQSGLENPTLTVVSYPAAWQELWNQAWAGHQPQPPLPSIDFVLSSVVVVGLGKRSGTGYTVSIDSIVIRVSGATLYATAVEPGANCGTGTAISSPVHMVNAPGHPPITDWRIASTRRNCTAAP